MGWVCKAYKVQSTLRTPPFPSFGRVHVCLKASLEFLHTGNLLLLLLICAKLLAGVKLDHGVVVGTHLLWRCCCAVDSVHGSSIQLLEASGLCRYTQESCP